MDKARFKRIAENKRLKLKQRGTLGSCSVICLSEQVNVAVIGIQTTERGLEHDTIFVVRDNGGNTKVETVIDKKFSKGGLGRMWPTSISKDGKKFSYVIKDDKGTRSNHARHI